MHAAASKIDAATIVVGWTLVLRGAMAGCGVRGVIACTFLATSRLAHHGSTRDAQSNTYSHYSRGIDCLRHRLLGWSCADSVWAVAFVARGAGWSRMVWLGSACPTTLVTTPTSSFPSTLRTGIRTLRRANPDHQLTHMSHVRRMAGSSFKTILLPVCWACIPPSNSLPLKC
jgi:hypothetical protein